MQQGIEMIEVYELNNGKIDTILSATTNSHIQPPANPVYYNINGHAVSAEEYSQECGKYNIEGSNWVNAARKYKLDPSVINDTIDTY